MLSRVWTSIFYMYAKYYHFLFARTTLIYGGSISQQKNSSTNVSHFQISDSINEPEGNGTNGLSMIKISSVSKRISSSFAAWAIR
uniref:Putative secreted protein n=1 Tax=Anopheles darlingi TaxID=43151 RepID=A0A2M4D5Y6_ANODA